MKKMTILILFASLALLAMWANEFIYKGESFVNSYFFLMFGIGGIFYFLYRRGKDILEEQEQKDRKNKN